MGLTTGVLFHQGAFGYPHSWVSNSPTAEDTNKLQADNIPQGQQLAF